MKATLSFTLPEERDEFETAVDAGDWRAVVEEVLSDFRSALKYNAWDTDTVPTSSEEAVEWARARLLARLDERGLLVD